MDSKYRAKSSNNNKKISRNKRISADILASGIIDNIGTFSSIGLKKKKVLNNHNSDNHQSVITILDDDVPTIHSPDKTLAIAKSNPVTPVHTDQERSQLEDSSDSGDEKKTDCKIETDSSIIPQMDFHQKLDMGLKMKDVVRVDVHNPKAREIITENRLNGTPVVIVGHNGWVNFARPWLVKTEAQQTSFDGGKKVSCILIDDDDDDDNEDIDLCNNQYRYSIEYFNMIKDIGSEIVPISIKNYRETNPTPKKMSVEEFLTKHWGRHTDSTHYLHQWQFTDSKTAFPKMHNQCKPLPNNIFGLDILKYYEIELADDKYYDNPYQYIFMGCDGTSTRLHVDHGGLDISIAPIYGTKLCTLIHRDDAPDCFNAKNTAMDMSDLNQNPLLSQARIWQTTIKPGEILLMPQVSAK
jgi:hypothetical protein